MKVMKFGGTSVGSAARIKSMVELVRKEPKAFVVLSAMSGTTNSLISISDALLAGKPEEALEIINSLEDKYVAVADELLSKDDLKKEGMAYVKDAFNALREYAAKPHTDKLAKEVVSFGERLSTKLAVLYMKELGMNVIRLNALDFMKTDADREPDQAYIREQLSNILDGNPGYDVYLTQGFICRNHNGEIDNLERGGSDYTASLIGVAADADEIQIWTDIDGMHNNDPRFVEGTSPVSELHFEEAAELAYFGAKILHPTCVKPAKSANIPVRLLNTMEPDAPGTLIYNTEATHAIKAVAAKDNITAIKIKSTNMLLAYGFLRKIFEIFEKYRTPIDMITTSEVGVSVTIDNCSALNEIVGELEEFGEVSVLKDMVIICVVGDLEWRNRGFEADVVNALKGIPVRMISYGGSNYNISLLIRKEDKVEALNLLSASLFK